MYTDERIPKTTPRVLKNIHCLLKYEILLIDIYRNANDFVTKYVD